MSEAKKYAPKVWETVPCPFCFSEKSKLFEKFGSDLQYQYVQCNNCSLIYQSPRPKYDQDFIDAAYGAYYQFNENLDLNESTEVSQSGVQLFTEELSNLSQFDKEKSNVLDIGSGMGTFLFAAKKYYKKAVGLDMSKQMGEWVSKKLGVEIFFEQFDDFNYPEKFSLIHMSHVMEHIPNPNDWLQKAKTMLTKEGILVINVPNKYALATRFQHLYVQLGFKKQVSKEWGKDVNRTPDHLFEPNTKSMLMLLERNNFEVLDYFSYSRKDAASNKSVFAKIYNRYFNWGSNLSFIVRNKN
jgi:SAM-dependent methyltransferase